MSKHVAKCHKYLRISAAQHINFIFPRKCDLGTPKTLSRGNAENSGGNSGIPIEQYSNVKKTPIQGIPGNSSGCSFFAYNWKLPAYSGAFLLTIDNFSLFTYSWSFFTYSFSFSNCSWSFFTYSGKVPLISALRDCKQRSSTVSKKAPTVSKKASPNSFWGSQMGILGWFSSADENGQSWYVGHGGPKSLFGLLLTPKVILFLVSA